MAIYDAKNAKITIGGITYDVTSVEIAYNVDGLSIPFRPMVPARHDFMKCPRLHPYERACDWAEMMQARADEIRRKLSEE